MVQEVIAERTKSEAGSGVKAETEEAEKDASKTDEVNTDPKKDDVSDHKGSSVKEEGDPSATEVPGTDDKKEPDEDAEPEPKEPETCAACEELRPQKSEESAEGTDSADSTSAPADSGPVTPAQRPCPECEDLLPEGVAEREKTYTPTALKAHMFEWHSDYTLAVMWRDNQKKVFGSRTVWMCPSKRCPWV